MILFVNILLLTGILFLGYKGTRKSPLGKYYLPGLILKLIAGIGVGLVYSLYYSNGDTFAMFDEGVKLKEAAFGSAGDFISIFFRSDYAKVADFAYPIQPRAAFMAKILSCFALITNSNYWLTSLYLSVLSFWGFWLLANSLYNISSSGWVAVIPTLFFPSIVFWTSGILKETVAIAAMAAVIAVSLRLYFNYKTRWTYWVVFVLGFLLVVQLKYYYAATLAVAVISLFITRALTTRINKWYWVLLTNISVFSILLLLGSLTHPNFGISRLMDVIVDNYYQYLALSTPDNVMHFKNLMPTMGSFLCHTPRALFGGLFSPLLINCNNPLQILVATENWLIILASIVSLVFFKIPASNQYRILMFTALIFVFITAVLLTFSAPNFGTLVRYKAGYLIVFVTLISFVIGGRISRS